MEAGNRKLETGLITIILLFVCCLITANISSQSLSAGKIIRKDTLKHYGINCDSAKSNDIRDIINRVSKRNVFHISDSARGKDDFHYTLIPAAGYALATGFTGVVASNMSFYLEPDKSKLSSILASAYYSQYNQYWLLLNSNIFYKKLNFVGDWRIYHFPTNTFGLGTDNSLSDAERIDFSYLKFYEDVMKEILPDLYAGLGYHLDYHWRITEYPTPENYVLTEYDERGPHSTSSGFSIDVLYDNRKNSINPQNGLYCNIQLKNCLTALGSYSDWNSLLIDVRKYIKLPGCSDNVLALWCYDNFTLNGKPPYLDLPSTGWDSYNNTGRGYVQGRYRGIDLIYLESEYRFSLTRDGMLGGVIFANGECIPDWQPSNNNKSVQLVTGLRTINSVQPGAGLGIRIKLNKSSGANLCLDYGFGTGGSRGFFLNVGEVF